MLLILINKIKGFEELRDTPEHLIVSSMQDAFHCMNLVVQQVECPPGVCKVIGSNPTGNSDFLFLSRSWHTI